MGRRVGLGNREEETKPQDSQAAHIPGAGRWTPDMGRR